MSGATRAGSTGADATPKASSLAVFGFAFGYLACYVPYAAITKLLTTQRDGRATYSGLSLLPLSAATSAVSMLVSLTALGWWRYAGTRSLGGRALPCPGKWTGLSGLATALIVLTTTLAYTFSGVSIPFVMLMMRGGVLLLAPLVDVLAGRHVRWFSWTALVLSLLGLADVLTRRGGGGVTLAVVADVAIYLGAYFVRLRLMAKLGKVDDKKTMLRFFVEEQMVATPAAVLLLGLAALGGWGPLVALREGFVEVPLRAEAPLVVLLGALSQGTGFFGALVLLDARESTFAVPLNRAASILAGVIAAFALAAFGVASAPPRSELVGAALLVSAVGVLSLGPTIEASAPTPAATRALARELVRLPNLLSLVRLPLALVFLLVVERPALALGVLALAGLSDVLDGWVARRLGQESKLGAALDGVVDKVFVLTVGLGLVLANKLPLAEALMLGARDLGELALLAWLSAHHALHPERERRALRLGKLTTLVQFAVIVVAIVGAPQRGTLAVLAGVLGVGAAVEYWSRERAQQAP
jgi:phosphatidylglycerophosphate synthase